MNFVMSSRAKQNSSLAPPCIEKEDALFNQRLPFVSLRMMAKGSNARKAPSLRPQHWRNHDLRLEVFHHALAQVHLGGVLASDVLVDLSGGSSRRVKQIFLARRTADHALCQWTRSCPLLAGAASVLNGGPPH